MKIYAVLLSLAKNKDSVECIIDAKSQPPAWILRDEEKDSLGIVRSGLYSISGVDPTYYPYINQAGTFEYFRENEKEIYIVYTVYFPSIFELVNEAYQWKNISELDINSKFYNIIRYIYGSKKYV